MLLGVDPLVIGVGDLGAALRDPAALGLHAARFSGGPTPRAALAPRVSHDARLSSG